MVSAQGRGSRAGKRRRKRRFIEDIEHLPPTLTIPEFAVLMNCTRQHIWAQVKAGRIKTTVALGRIQRIPRPEAIRIYRGELPRRVKKDKGRTPHGARPFDDGDRRLSVEAELEDLSRTELEKAQAPDPPTPIHVMAIRYVVELNLAVIPLHTIVDGICTCWRGADCRHPGQHPLTKNGVLDASRDLLQVKLWWTKWRLANIGLPCGVINGFTALDVDLDHGGFEALAALEKEFGPLPAGVRQYSGGGAEHRCFAYDARVPNRVGFLTGLDSRNDNGYLVAAPSVHRSGRLYRLDPQHRWTNTPVLPPMPEWLLERMLAGTSTTRQAAPANEWRARFAEPCTEGRRNALVTQQAGHLLRHGIDPYVVLELLGSWNRAHCLPPLHDDEVLQIVNSICSREAARRENQNGR